MAEAEGALPALVAGMAPGGDIATNCTQALGCIAGADPALLQRVAKAPGALPALVAAVAAGGGAAVTARRTVATIRSWAKTAVAAAGAACGHCGRSADEAMGVRMRVCAGCNKARYCNSECQNQAWGSHKAACRIIVATSAGNMGA